MMFYLRCYITSPLLCMGLFCDFSDDAPQGRRL